MDEITTEMVNTLARITTSDHAGRHFTEVYDPEMLDTLEDLSLIEITRPVHEATGIPYSPEHWTVTVTEEGQDVVNDRYDPRDDPDSD